MAASTSAGRTSSAPVYIEEPAFSRWLFGSSKAAWIWLIARLWLGWEWLQAGWSKLFGGNITWKFWNWGDAAYSLTGHGNIGWVRSGTVATEDGGQRTLQVGDAVAGFARGALERGTAGEHPDIAYSWYVSFLEWVRDTGHTVLGFAGSAGVNPAMIAVAGVLILAWRNAGWYGLDRFLLPKLGTPWHRGELFTRTASRTT
jgi:thiosulfate dehydrogenase (quinone) large subunit